jgi:aspartate/methionine/tyrosine aminotransferase
MPLGREIPFFEYMRFAKEVQFKGPYNLTGSGFPSLPPGALPVAAEKLPLTIKEAYGVPSLIEAVARRYGVPPGEVCIAPGTSGVNFFLYGALLSPGDEIVVEQPTYEILWKLPALFGAKAVRWRREAASGFRADPETLAPLLNPRTRAVVITNPHNPSGAVIAPEDLARLARMTSDRGIALIADEVYLDFLPGATPLRRLGGLCVTTSSLTKAYGLGGLRVGWALAPAELVEALNRFHDLASVQIPSPSQVFAIEAFARLDALRAAARARFEANFPAVDRWVRESGFLSWTPPKGTLFGFPRIANGVEASALCDLLDREFGTYLVPGRFFDGMDDHFRVGFGGEPAVVAEGLSRVSKAMGRLAP